MAVPGLGIEAAAPAGTLLGAVERRAWRLGRSTRRFFLAAAIASAATLTLSGLAASVIVARNASTISSARDEGLGVAREAAEFRTQLAAADAQAATTLLVGGLESPEALDTYDGHLATAGRALTEAALLAPDDDQDEITALADGLVDYARLVETARANSRQGYPVGASYLTRARAVAEDELAPMADRLRRSGEQRVARAANSVAGPSSALAVLSLGVGLVVLAASATMVAGRTRKFTHPALLGAGLAATACFAVVTSGIWGQGRELRAAATDDVGAYVAANDTASTLSNLRVMEIGAVAARGSGGPLYDRFAEDVAALEERLVADAGGEAPADGPDGRLIAGVSAYGDAVTPIDPAPSAGSVRDTDERGDNRLAAELTLTGDAATAFTEADGLAREVVDRTADRLARRFDAAAEAEVGPLVPLALGGLAAALAAGGALDRGRRYR